MAMITVQCSDGILIDVDKEMALSMSGAIKKQLENKSNEPTTITVDNITGHILMKVLDFCSVYTAPHSVPNFKAWGDKFVRLEPAELCELASAAYYLEIRPLVDLTCKSIAKLLKGKSPAEIRRTFNILYDFSPGDDVPPPTMRDKLRTKLHFKDKGKDKGKDSDREKQDNRSVDELVSFINENPLLSNKVAGETKVLKEPVSKKIKNKGKKLKMKKSTEVEMEAETEVDTGTESTEQLLLTETIAKHFKDLKPELTKYEETTSEVDASNDNFEDELDPELKAAEDKEVEEFRLRLESIQRNETRPKIMIPSFESLLSLTSGGTTSKG